MTTLADGHLLRSNDDGQVTIKSSGRMTHTTFDGAVRYPMDDDLGGRSDDGDSQKASHLCSLSPLLTATTSTTRYTPGLRALQEVQNAVGTKLSPLLEQETPPTALPNPKCVGIERVVQLFLLVGHDIKHSSVATTFTITLKLTFTTLAK
jgi:hypothetical protein